MIRVFGEVNQKILKSYTNDPLADDEIPAAELLEVAREARKMWKDSQGICIDSDGLVNEHWLMRYILNGCNRDCTCPSCTLVTRVNQSLLISFMHLMELAEIKAIRKTKRGKKLIDHIIFCFMFLSNTINIAHRTGIEERAMRALDMITTDIKDPNGSTDGPN